MPPTYTANEPLIANIEFIITIDDAVKSPFLKLKVNYVNDFKRKMDYLGKYFIPPFLEQDEYSIRNIHPLLPIINFQVKESALNTKVIAYVSDYQEMEGSDHHIFVVFLESIVLYSHLREAIHKIHEDLQTLFSVRGYSVQFKHSRMPEMPDRENSDRTKNMLQALLTPISILLCASNILLAHRRSCH